LDTPETGDPGTGWVTVGTVEFTGDDAGFHPWLRHRFDLGATNGATIQATGFRIKISDPSAAIDEIEINTAAPPQQETPVLTISAAGTEATISWTGGGTLQSADALPGPWADVAGDSPQRVSTATGTQKFYRVRK
jgi:hypothetical protein